ncbi:MAG: DUF898 domain-containing protein [SAR324 cluster bacterium]|nr:DUF898 domain-containing protein [SAR324 cluster bacterium]
MSKDDKEKVEFNELLSRQELKDSENTQEEAQQTAEVEAERSLLEGSWPLSFEGEGGELFGILIKNLFLNILTLGIYYPWAKATQLRFYYGSSRIHDSDFQFHGTGAEMFIGLLKVFGVLLILDFIYEGILAGVFEEGMLFFIGFLYFLIFMLLMLFASVGVRRYRMSRTSWRGIRFRFLGTFKDTGILIVKGWLLTLLSLGFYYPYYLNRFQEYWISTTTFGNIAFSYDGEGKEVFRIWLKGMLLTVLTFGLYSFWLRANLQRYFWSHTSYAQASIVSRLYGGRWLKESLIFLLIMILTLGMGRAWAIVRYKKFYLGTLCLEGIIDLAAIKQAEAKLSNATGEGMADYFDVEM